MAVYEVILRGVYQMASVIARSDDRKKVRKVALLEMFNQGHEKMEIESIKELNIRKKGVITSFWHGE